MSLSSTVPSAFSDALTSLLKPRKEHMARVCCLCVDDVTGSEGRGKEDEVRETGARAWAAIAHENNIAMRVPKYAEEITILPSECRPRMQYVWYKEVAKLGRSG